MTGAAGKGLLGSAVGITYKTYAIDERISMTTTAGIGELGSISDAHRQDLISGHAVAHWAIDKFQFTTGSKGVLIPWSDGESTVLIGRLDTEHRRPGAPKYLWPSGRSTFPGIHIPPGETTRTVLVVEGTLQSYAAASWAPAGVAVVGIQGADGIHRQTDVSWASERDIVLLFDADAATNTRVGGAAGRVSALLMKAGATSVRLASLPSTAVQTRTDGLDDVLARTDPGARSDLIAQIIDSAADHVTVDGAGEVMTDAGVSASLVADRLLGTYRWSPGLGWMSWDGVKWSPVNVAEVEEAGRVWVLGKWRNAMRLHSDLMSAASSAPDPDRSKELQGQADAVAGAIKAWRSYQAAGRISGICKMARGIPGVICDDADYDAHPDLLNTPSGVVDLRTGELRAHDPKLLLTKVTTARYRPGATHEEWDAAVSAIPEDIRPWMQLRMGQGVTGHTPGDDAMIVMDGDGRNGKTTFCESIRYALGRDDAYAVLVSHRAVIGDPGQHPTELMAFRGARLAFLEETPEEHRLNVTRLKTLLGVSTMRARLMRQDEVSWEASHSLVLNTNYLPTIVETDHGTWRRLVRVRWPYTFVAAAEASSRALRPHELPGRDGIRERLRSGVDGRGEAILAWLVDGAKAWYAAGMIMPGHPARVVADTEAWRGLSDDLGAFAAERITFDPAGAIGQADFTAEFTAWLAEQNQRPWGARLIAARVRSHPAFIGGKVDLGVAKINGKRVKAWVGMRFGQNGHDDGQGGPGGHGGSGPDENPDVGGDLQVFAEARSSVPLVPQAPILSKEEPRVERNRASGTSGTDISLRENRPLTGVSDPDVFAAVPDTGSVVFDLETAGKGVDMWRAPTGDFVRLSGWADLDGGRAGTAPGAAPVLELVAPGGPGIVGHNIMGFDLVALARHHGVDIWDLASSGRVMDTMLTWILANPPRGGAEIGKILREFSLDRIGERVFGVGKTDSLQRLAALHGGFGSIPADDPDYNAYCAGDVALTARIARMIHEQGWVTDYSRREHLVAAVAAQIRLNGFRIDVDEVDRRVAEGEAKRERIVAWLQRRHGLPEGGAAPHRSDAGRQAVSEAFRALGVELPRTTSGKPSSAKDVMTELSGHPDQNVAALADAILALNGIRTVYGTISDNLVGDRVHPEITMYQASGRWSITEPGLTVLGKRGGRHVERKVLLPEEGHVIIAADLSQIDARAVAAHSGDRAYARNFDAGRDLHSEVSRAVWGTVTPELRSAAKVIGHGWNYGMGLARLGEACGSPDQARQYDQAMRDTYPRLVAWKADVARAGERGDVLTNAWGRQLRPDPERAWTQSPALVGQSTARDVMMQWLINIMGEPRMRPALRAVVHDEVVLSVPREEAREAAAFLLQALPGPLVVGDGPEVAVTADVTDPGESWGAVYDH